METLTLANLKGGAGKTTSAVCMAEEVASRGHPVLLVDWDPQATLSSWISDRGPSATELARGELSSVRRSTAQAGEGDTGGGAGRIDLVAADRSLAETGSGRAATLARHLEAYLEAAAEGYDLALVDVQPSVGPLVLGALMATGRALVPVEAGPGAVEGLHHTRQLLQRTGAGSVAAAWACRVDVRRSLDKKARGTVRKATGPLEEGGAGADTQIREAVAVPEAQAAGEWPRAYDPGMTPLDDYADLTDELTTTNTIEI